MNQADLGHTPNASRVPSGGSEQPGPNSGTSVFAVLVAMSFLVMATFFALSFWAVWKRSEESTAQLAPAVNQQRNTMQSSDADDSEIWLDAMVNLKRLDRGDAQLRASADFNGMPVGEFAHGSPVKVAQSSVKNHKTWYRVKGMYRGAMVEGWMHSDIVSVVQGP